jgi:hypothetical protein
MLEVGVDEDYAWASPPAGYIAFTPRRPEACKAEEFDRKCRQLRRTRQGSGRHEIEDSRLAKRKRITKEKV